MKSLLLFIICFSLGLDANGHAFAQESSQLPDPDGKPADLSKPVQVYILLGQSNMLGFGLSLIHI